VPRCSLYVSGRDQRRRQYTTEIKKDNIIPDSQNTIGKQKIGTDEIKKQHVDLRQQPSQISWFEEERKMRVKEPASLLASIVWQLCPTEALIEGKAALLCCQQNEETSRDSNCW
jgi:hypothetical protein